MKKGGGELKLNLEIMNEYFESQKAHKTTISQTELNQRQAVRKIETFWIHQKWRTQAKEMRKECQNLPYVCRRGYVKMWHLKLTTSLFRSQATKFTTRLV